jgi:hypothetical protein
LPADPFSAYYPCSLKGRAVNRVPDRFETSIHPEKTPRPWCVHTPSGAKNYERTAPTWIANNLPACHSAVWPVRVVSWFHFATSLWFGAFTGPLLL